MGIHRNDRLYRDLEKAVYPDEARIDRAGRLSRERAATQYKPSRPLLLLLVGLLSDAPAGRHCPTIRCLTRQCKLPKCHKREPSRKADARGLSHGICNFKTISGNRCCAR